MNPVRGGNPASTTVMITTGGTGGHIFPGLAVACRLVERGFRVFWLGTRGGMEATLVPRHGVDFEAVRFASVRGKGLLRLVVGPYAILAACIESLRVIRRRSPDVVVGFGGFASFPGALMAVAASRPLVIHESNSVAGLANRVLAWGADRVLAGFPGSFGPRPPKRFECVGNPLRPAIVAVPAPRARFAARSGPLRLLVVGGSLGATALNEGVPRALALLPAATRPSVVHQTGERGLESTRSTYRECGVEAECVAFIDDMAAAYSTADLVLCRSGALTVSELAAVGVASILVPLPGAIADEQTTNARFLSRAGAAILLPQAELTAEGLAALIGGQTRAVLLDIACRAHALGRRDATDRVADICAELGSGR